MVTLAELFGGTPPPLAEIKQAAIEGFAETLGIAPEWGGITEADEETAGTELAAAGPVIPVESETAESESAGGEAAAGPDTEAIAERAAEADTDSAAEETGPAAPEYSEQRAEPRVEAEAEAQAEPPAEEDPAADRKESS